MKWTVVCVLTGSLAAQTPVSSSGIHALWEMPKAGGITTGYRTPRVADVYFEDSVRLQSLFRDGKIYLSLRDAISLALENNLDLEWNGMASAWRTATFCVQRLDSFRAASRYRSARVLLDWEHQWWDRTARSEAAIHRPLNR